MSKYPRRTPKNYEGTASTTHHVSELLTSVLTQIGEVYRDRPDLLLAAWPEIIGPKLANMTQAVSFVDGILLVNVKNSTLHSLLSRHDRPKILASLRQRFPKLQIQNIRFRIG